MVRGYCQRNILVLVFALLFFVGLKAQDNFVAEPTPVMHESRDWSLSISPNYVYHPDAFPRVVGGLNSMVFIGRFISLNANFAAGQGYVQFGSGLFGVPALLLGGAEVLFSGLGTEGFLVFATLIATAFENMNFHIPVSSHFELVPYFSLLRVKYIKEGYGVNGNTWNMNLAGGVRMNIYLSDKHFIAPYVETNRDWRFGGGGLWGINGGIHAGFYFRAKQ